MERDGMERGCECVGYGVWPGEGHQTSAHNRPELPPREYLLKCIVFGVVFGMVEALRGSGPVVGAAAAGSLGAASGVGEEPECQAEGQVQGDGQGQVQGEGQVAQGLSLFCVCSLMHVQFLFSSC